MHPCSSLPTIALILCSPLLFGQTTPAGAGTPEVANATVNTVEKLIQDQFGPGYKLLPEFAPLAADFDGDGIEDLAVAAKAVNPLLTAVEHHYKVIDPYHSFFGYGNPKVMMEFGTEDPRLQGRVVLIVHGAKDGGWHAAQPKAKFVIVNLPFTKVSLSHVLRRKKPLAAVAAEEPDSITAVIYWDGKKYKYEPMGADTD